jgi:large subunit ribosomal protein L19
MRPFLKFYWSLSSQKIFLFVIQGIAIFVARNFWKERKPMNILKSIEEMAKNRAIDVRKKKDGDNFAEIPNFTPGDQINVAVRVVEGEKERIQNFKGIVLGRRGAGLNQTFTVRKISNGVGVERVFPLYSPMVQSIEVIREGRARRAKLYYLRGMSDRKIRAKLS